MKIFIYSSFLALGLFASTANAQVLDSLLKQTKPAGDSTLVTNKDAIYNRPFVLSANLGRSSTALGGYVEGNTNYFATDGVSDGFTMELRRFNLFVYSSVANKIKFLSEVEFEHGTEEIALETALLDFEFHPMFNFRAGILLPPIGYFNQNHDSPKWEFVDRPLVSTTIIPATLSEVGFGVHGKIPVKENKAFTYEVYLVNGLRDQIIANAENRTSLQAGKNPEMFAEDNNGSPMLTGRIAIKDRKHGEIGVSYYGGIYNTFQADGLILDNKRSLHLFALDYNLSVKKLQINGEAAWVQVEVPTGYTKQFGSKQKGVHVDFIYPVRKGVLLSWNNTVLNANFRFEYADYNVGTFTETTGNIADDIIAVVPGVSLRLQSNTVIRANYRYHWQQDLVGNPAARTAGFQFGVASYF